MEDEPDWEAQQIAALQVALARLEARVTSSETMVNTADKVLTIRLDHSNNTLAHMETQQREAGLQLAKLAAEFARRAEVELSVKALSDRLDSISQRVYWLLGVSAAAGGTAGIVAAKFFT